jgi:hypothetical protein
MMTLQAEWQVADDQLRVAYRLTNGHPAAAYVYAVPRTSGLRPRPGTAYAPLAADDADLTLLLGASPLPERMRVAVKIQPLAVLVPPRKEFAGEVRLPVPVVEWGAYSNPDDTGEGRERVTAYRLHLVIEYVLEGETYFCQQTPDGAMWDVGGTPVRRVAATHVPDHPVPVLKRPRGS